MPVAPKPFATELASASLAQRSLHDGFPDLTGEYILTFHALELALKAFLAKCGLSNAALARKPYGHDLLKLYAEARARGLKVSVHKAAELLEWVNEYHDQGALLCYDFTETRELPSCATLFPIVKEILAESQA